MHACGGPGGRIRAGTDDSGAKFSSCCRTAGSGARAASAAAPFCAGTLTLPTQPQWRVSPAPASRCGRGGLLCQALSSPDPPPIPHPGSVFSGVEAQLVHAVCSAPLHAALRPFVRRLHAGPPQRRSPPLRPRNCWEQHQRCCAVPGWRRGGPHTRVSSYGRRCAAPAPPSSGAAAGLPPRNPAFR